MSRTVKYLALAVLFIFSLAACQLAPAPPAFNHDDGWYAIEEAFADHGPGVVATFHCIAQRESGHSPYAQNGRYAGLLQIDSTNGGYIGSMHAAAATLGRAPSFFDPYVNARTGRIIYDVRLSKGLNPTGPWSTAGGC